MARTIVVHVGTSLLQSKALAYQPPVGAGTPAALAKDLADGIPAAGRLAGWANAFQVGLRHYWGDGGASEAERRETSPGEVASLNLLRLQPGDRVVLLHTATPSGSFCAKLLQLALEDRSIGGGFPTCEPAVVEAKGLTVEGNAGGRAAADRFVREGLAAYVDAVWDEYKALKELGSAGGPHSLVFNITGGYKGLIPVARDLALLLGSHGARGPAVRCSLCYLFQSSDQLIWYGTLPVGFRFDLLPAAALEQAAGPTGFHAPVASEHDAYFEPKPGSPGRLALSPLGTVLFALYKKMR